MIGYKLLIFISVISLFRFHLDPSGTFLQYDAKAIGEDNSLLLHNYHGLANHFFSNVRWRTLSNRNLYLENFLRNYLVHKKSFHSRLNDLCFAFHVVFMETEYVCTDRFVEPWLLIFFLDYLLLKTHGISFDGAPYLPHLNSFFPFNPLSVLEVQSESDLFSAHALPSGFTVPCHLTVRSSCGFAFGHSVQMCFMGKILHIWHLKG